MTNPPKVGGFDNQGDALPAEMLPAALSIDGVNCALGPSGSGKVNAVVGKGQSITLPQGNYNKVYVLVASANGDQRATFNAGKSSVTLTLQDWSGPIGQWDTRVWKPKPDFVTEGGGRSGTAEHQRALRKEYARCGASVSMLRYRLIAVAVSPFAAAACASA